MKIKLKYLIITVAIGVVLYAGYRLFANLAFSGTFEKKYTRKDAVENFNRSEKEIMNLVDYFKTQLPSDRDITFGLGKSSNSFNIGIALPDGKVDVNHPNVGGSNLKLNSDKSDSILSLIGWTNETAETLKSKLKKVNCLNIMSGEPIRIEYQYSGLGLHSYLIFNKPIADSMLKTYRELGDTVLRKNIVAIYTSSL